MQAAVQEGSQGGRQSHRVEKTLNLGRGCSFGNYKYMIYNHRGPSRGSHD